MFQISFLWPSCCQTKKHQLTGAVQHNTLNQICCLPVCVPARTKSVYLASSRADIQLLFIHPLRTGLFQIFCRGNTSSKFGLVVPLVDGSVVSRRSLGGSVCLSVYLPVSVYLSFCLSPCIRLTDILSVCLSANLSDFNGLALYVVFWNYELWPPGGAKSTLSPISGDRHTECVYVCVFRLPGPRDTGQWCPAVAAGV